MQALPLQRFTYDCGPTALYGALVLYGREVRYTDIARWAGTTPEKGTSAAGLKRVLEYLEIPYSEYNSRSRRISWAWAKRQNLPTILCFDNDEHWVLLVAGFARRVLVFDPEVGMLVYTRKDFMNRWTTTRGGVYALQLRRA